MDALRKIRGRRGSTSEATSRKLTSPHTCSDAILNTTETDGPFNFQVVARKKQANKDFMDMPPDKQLDEKVLLGCWEFLTENMPAEDVAPMMVSEHLLTQRENVEYIAKKNRRESIINLSEYLLECLRKRQGGSLKKLCIILWKIEAAKYLGDHIQDKYSAAYSQEGFNPSSRDRLSRISLSDSDISQRAKSSKGNTTQSCAACKELKKRNRQLEKENNELWVKCSRLQEGKIKLEAQLEVLQDQLQQDEREKQNLTKAYPKLQEALTQIERYCRMSETLKTQQTLKKINCVMREQNEHDSTPMFIRRRNLHIQSGERSRESMLSMQSDNSSMADCSTAEEELSRSSSHTYEINSPLVTTAEKPGAYPAETDVKSPPSISGNSREINNSLLSSNAEKTKELSQTGGKLQPGSCNFPHHITNTEKTGAYPEDGGKSPSLKYNHTCETNLSLVSNGEKTGASSETGDKSPSIISERQGSFICAPTLIPPEKSNRARSPKQDAVDTLTNQRHQNSTSHHIRSESSPSTDVTKQRSNTHPRKGRHHSLSGNMSIATRPLRSQSVKNGNRTREQASTPTPQHYLQGDAELTAKLVKRRQKLESQSESHEQI